MTSRGVNADTVVPPLVAGRVGAGALAFGALGNLMTVPFGRRGGGEVIAGVGVTVALGVLAAAAAAIPWNRFHRRMTLLLVPIVLAVAAAANYADPLAYVAGCYFVVIGAWVGLCHRRWTTLALAPAFALSFWIPLAVRPNQGRLGASTVIVTAIAVAIGESLALMRTRVDASRAAVAASARRRLDALVLNSADVVFLLGKGDTIRYVSPAAVAQFGFDPALVTRMPLGEFLSNHVDGLDRLPVGVRSENGASRAGLVGTAEFRVRHVDGHWIDVEATIQNLLDDPDIEAVVVHVRDIRERKALQSDLLYRAFHDDLTGLVNRAGLGREIDRRHAEGRPISVAVMDIDDFKDINDTFGHTYGDLVLQVFAKRLSAALPDGAVAGRLGGDEFAIVMDVDLAEAERETTRITRRISGSTVVGGILTNVAVSAGVAHAGPGAPVVQVMADADLAMYESKRAGDGMVVLYDEHVRQQTLDRLSWQNDLRIALARNEFVLFYQPQVDHTTGATVGAEALIRWRRPGIGLVAPGEFIPLAEEMGVVVDIGRWVLRTACAEASRWAAAGSAIPVSVNVSPQQFRHDTFIEDVVSAIDESGIGHDQLKIELTETMFIEDMDLVVDRIMILKELGIGLALDDFGTGYASLSYLRSLPFDVLKVDRSFLTDATTDPMAFALLSTINQLGHDLGLLTLVEGVETAEQVELVAQLGFDLIQGFYFARPVDAAEFRCRLAPPTVGVGF